MVTLLAKHQEKSPNTQSLGAPADAALAKLTCREHEILCMLAQGLTNKAVATELSISEQTVKCHAKHIYHKLGVKSRTQAVLLYMKHR